MSYIADKRLNPKLFTFGVVNQSQKSFKPKL